jgi:CheY-like chemotaxis protein
MDCEMPYKNGFEATMEIRDLFASGHVQEIPIIATTAASTFEERLQCEAAGMVDFLAKPIEREHLEEILLKWILLDEK